MTGKQIRQHNALWKCINLLSFNDREFVGHFAPSMELTESQADRFDKLTYQYRQSLGFSESATLEEVSKYYEARPK